MKSSVKCISLVCVVALASNSAHARVTRIDAEASKPLPVRPGQTDYELISGRFQGELDPNSNANRIITDIDKAPRNGRGMVEYSATFAIARPVDPAKSSGVLFYQVPNRGGGVQLGPDADGHVRVISGWQGDIPPAKGLQYVIVPTAKQPNGAPVTGLVTTRTANISADAKSVFIGSSMGRMTPRPAPVSLDTSKASLVAERSGRPDESIDPADWAFADCENTPFPGTPDPVKLCLKNGFDPDAAYRLVYEGKDPPILGIGWAATRDLIAFLRSGKPDDAGNANPAGGTILWTIGQGNSQSGNFLRSFVHLGFNADEGGARVFDGINPNIAARQLVLNLRFSLPGGAASPGEPGSEGTLWWGRYNDKVRKQGSSSLLDRCNANDTCPKVIETLGSAEFWGLRASPGFVGTDAKKDIALPANVRRYYFPSVTHGGSWAGGFKPEGETVPMFCELPGNFASTREPMRAAFAMLVNWVKDDKTPPASRYPRLSKRELVAPTAKAMGWPKIPGAPVPDGKINPFNDYDFGSSFIARDVSGVMDKQPPTLRRFLPQRVPRVNGDGNETVGVAPIQLRVPLGTHTGWNVTAKGYGKGEGCGFAGGFIPFARTKAERESSGDPRPSLEERYRDHAGFVTAVKKAASEMVAEGWMFADDAARVIADAEASSVLK